MACGMMLFCMWCALFSGGTFFLEGSSSGTSLKNDRAAFAASVSSQLQDYDLTGMDEIDFTEIDDFLDTTMTKEDISFADIVEELISGDSDHVIATFGKKILNNITAEISVEKEAVLRIIFIGIAAAFFSNLAAVFAGNQAADMGFFVTYMLLVTILLGAFSVAASIGEEVLGNILDFMRALIPSYFLAVGLAGGNLAAIGFYELTLGVITAVEWVFQSFLMPAIKLYIIIILTNALATEDFLSKLAELIKTAIEWTSKTLFGLVIGIHVIQGMILPATDSAKNIAVQKIVSMLPGIGAGASVISDMFVGSGNIIKNGIGGAALIIIVLLCMVPIVKLCLLYFMYQGTAAFMQPMSEQRFIHCIACVSEGIRLISRVLVTTMMMFMITIAIICMSTS